jgi:hypothetical protein
MSATHPVPARTRVPSGLVLLGHVVLRAGAVLAVDRGYQLAIEHAPAGSGFDDPVGAGLVGFMVLGLAAGALGLVDGWFLDYGRVAVVWGLAAPLYAVTSVVVTNVSYDGPDLAVLATDLLALVPVLTVVLVAPALVAALLTWSLNPRRQ